MVPVRTTRDLQINGGAGPVVLNVSSRESATTELRINNPGPHSVAE